MDQMRDMDQSKQELVKLVEEEKVRFLILLLMSLLLLLLLLLLVQEKEPLVTVELPMGSPTGLCFSDMANRSDGRQI